MDRAFFDQGFAAIAAAIVGQRLTLLNGTVITVLKAKGFDRASNLKGYTGVVGLPSGSVHLHPSMGHTLILIATKDGSEPGGCVLVQAARIDGKVVDGPGKVSKALGLVYAKDPTQRTIAIAKPTDSGLVCEKITA